VYLQICLKLIVFKLQAHIPKIPILQFFKLLSPPYSLKFKKTHKMNPNEEKEIEALEGQM
jgi:hypothetical protein